MDRPHSQQNGEAMLKTALGLILAATLCVTGQIQAAGPPSSGHPGLPLSPQLGQGTSVSPPGQPPSVALQKQAADPPALQRMINDLVINRGMIDNLLDDVRILSALMTDDRARQSEVQQATQQREDQREKEWIDWFKAYRQGIEEQMDGR